MKDWFKIDKFKRYQRGLYVEFLFPKNKGFCGYCGKESKRRWCCKECSDNAVSEMLVMKGDARHIRSLLKLRDKGACVRCGHITNEWHADHILPVYKGGGACTIDNFQTLCVDCHKEKTLKDYHG